MEKSPTVREKRFVDWDSRTSDSATLEAEVSAFFTPRPAATRSTGALLRKGAAATGHNRADDNGYATTEDVGGHRAAQDTSMTFCALLNELAGRSITARSRATLEKVCP